MLAQPAGGAADPRVLHLTATPDYSSMSGDWHQSDVETVVAPSQTPLLSGTLRRGCSFDSSSAREAALDDAPMSQAHVLHAAVRPEYTTSGACAVQASQRAAARIARVGCRDVSVFTECKKVGEGTFG
ncbi:hypothetical protein EON67_07570 [archaeon]|nr:MAG: hypothetical protein EON67_07570 [archaeon]